MRGQVSGSPAVQINHDFGSKKIDFFRGLILVVLQRFAGTFFDTDGATLLRLESDGPAKTSGPYIAAKEINK